VLEHPVSSPDVAPIVFHLFPKIKEILKGRYFDDIDDISSNTTATLKAIPQNQFQNCFEGWSKYLYRCVASQGEYFEATTMVFSNGECNTFITISSQTLLSDHV
jgi:hypothetical protein